MDVTIIEFAPMVALLLFKAVKVLVTVGVAIVTVILGVVIDLLVTVTDVDDVDVTKGIVSMEVRPK